MSYFGNYSNTSESKHCVHHEIHSRVNEQIYSLAQLLGLNPAEHWHWWERCFESGVSLPQGIFRPLKFRWSKFKTPGAVGKVTICHLPYYRSESRGEFNLLTPKWGPYKIFNPAFCISVPVHKMYLHAVTGKHSLEKEGPAEDYMIISLAASIYELREKL